MGLKRRIKYLLDTNIVIGVLKGNPDVMALVHQHGIDFDNAALSQISRMELLSFSGMGDQEQQDINAFLDHCHVLLLDEKIEQATIAFRLAHGLKLPDAIIIATAQVHSLVLLTMDKRLHNVAEDEKNKATPPNNTP